MRNIQSRITSGGEGEMKGNGMVFDNYGNDITGNSGIGNNVGFGDFSGKHRVHGKYQTADSPVF